MRTHIRSVVGFYMSVHKELYCISVGWFLYESTHRIALQIFLYGHNIIVRIWAKTCWDKSKIFVDKLKEVDFSCFTSVLLIMQFPSQTFDLTWELFTMNLVLQEKFFCSDTRTFCKGVPINPLKCDTALHRISL